MLSSLICSPIEATALWLLAAPVLKVCAHTLVNYTLYLHGVFSFEMALILPEQIKQLEMNVQRLRQEKEQLQTSYRQADEQETLTLRKECESLHSQLQQCQHKVRNVHI